MEFAGSLCALAGALLLGMVGAALGRRFLRLLRVGISCDTEHLLFGAAVGFVLLEAAFFGAQLSGHIPLAFCIILAAAATLAAADFTAVLRGIANIVARGWQDSAVSRWLASATCLVLLIEGLAAMAPLTGSDALHYHFAAPAQVLRGGFAPDFFVLHSFLTGQGHLLILLGLALRSEKFALALLYLGGMLAAAGAACLTRAAAPRRYAWLAALAFLLSPVVFWQISTAGAPDLWMAFFASVGVLAIAKVREAPTHGLAAVCGMCAGVTAGTKYTGCIVAASLLLAFLWESRSLRLAAIFVAASLGAGIWPYARNLLWTGDPVFPFALTWFPVAQVNHTALAALLADTGVAVRLSLWQILQFPFFAAVDQKHLGFWQFFGPLCLVFAPMFFFLVPRDALWRASLVVWITGALGIGAISGMLRFLVFLLPVATAASLAGAAELCARASRTTRWLAMAAVGITLALGFAGMLVYVRPALATGLGLVSRDKYLQEYCPDYATSQFINSRIEGLSAATGNSGGKTMVFVQHLYNLHVPFVDGDPNGSWAVDPQRLRTAGEWQAFFHQNGIRWVVRSPEYPASLAASLNQLEAIGLLIPVARGEVLELSGMRILNQRRVLPIVILNVAQ